MARGEKLWVVRPADGATVGEILGKLNDPQAVVEGRVFVGKKRALKASDAVKPGDAVRVGPPVSKAAETSIPVLFEGDGLVAFDKPAGLPTVPDHAGSAHALVGRVARMIGRPEAELRVTSRLDRDVSGVVVFALDEDAEARLKNARAEGGYHRRYVALAAPKLGDDGTWDAPIGRARDPRLRRTNGEDAKPSRTRWRRVAETPLLALLAVDPETGRTHQIRVHASADGHALFGDRDYGGLLRLVGADGSIVAPARIALHAARVTVPDRAGRLVTVRAPVPAAIRAIWTAAGGQDAAWEDAVS